MHLHLNPIVENRFSPRSFSSQPLTDRHIELLLDAAHRAPSSGNAQPWRIIYARHGEAAHGPMAECLDEINTLWAPKAALLLTVCAYELNHKGQPNFYAKYDTGQSVAWLTVQAHEMNLWVHQMAGFDPDMARKNLALPEHVTPMTMIAVGYLGHPDALPAELPEKSKLEETHRRGRKPIHEVAFHGRFGEGLSLGEVVF